MDIKEKWVKVQKWPDPQTLKESRKLSDFEHGLIVDLITEREILEKVIEEQRRTIKYYQGLVLDRADYKDKVIVN